MLCSTHTPSPPQQPPPKRHHHIAACHHHSTLVFYSQQLPAPLRPHFSLPPVLPTPPLSVCVFSWFVCICVPVCVCVCLVQVRVGVLEREKAELDDRVAALETQLAATDRLAAQDFATKVGAGGGETLAVLKE